MTGMTATAAARSASTDRPAGGPVRMFVISDLHAVSESSRRHDSGVRTYEFGDPTSNALDAIRAVVAANDLSADVLLCPGDLVDANVGGPDIPALGWAWQQLIEIADLLGAELIATAGNHDIKRTDPEQPVVSDDDDPNAYLKALDPPFPTRDGQAAREYFEQDFTILAGARWRVVTLNTCAEHGIDHKRGSVRVETIDALEQALDDLPTTPVNVLLCHHHPVQWTHLNRSDRDHMRLGEHLLRMLDTRARGRWVVVHGHRHIPTVGYVGESSSGPVRFSAGSVGCALLPDIGTAARNQFYMLTFDVSELEQLDLVGAGRFRAWDWVPTIGPRPATRPELSGLPHHGGFGFRRDGHELASLCRRLAKERTTDRLRWSELVDRHPRWRYVAPVDLSAMASDIELDGGRVLFAADGTIDEVHCAFL